MLKPGFNKRAGFKNKTGFSNRSGIKQDNSKAKRNGLKRAKRKEKLTDPFWKEIHLTDRAFSIYIRILHANSQGYVKCFTCGKRGFWKRGGIECGHYMSRSHMRLRWTTANAKPQCISCNQILSGNKKEYRKRLIKFMGENAVMQLEDLAQDVCNLTIEDVQAIKRKINSRVRELRKDKGI